MGTFLTTDRMNPALRARVERAVSRRARAAHHASHLGLDRPFARRGKIGIARLFPILVAIVLGVLATWMYVHEQRALEEERGALLGAITDRRAALPRGHEAFVATTDRWLGEVARDGATPDVVDPALRAPGALEALLRRPSVYVHGPAAELGDLRKIDDAVRGSSKDAFLVCLMHPPASSSESDRLAKVRGVYFAGAKVDDETTSARRLAEARIGLRVLSPAFEAAVRQASEREALARFRRELETAPIDLAAKAASADLMIIVADIPHGEAHVAIVDLASNRVLFSARRRLEEQGTSSMASLYREQLEECSLALAVQRAVIP